MQPGLGFSLYLGTFLNSVIEIHLIAASRVNR